MITASPAGPNTKSSWSGNRLQVAPLASGYASKTCRSILISAAADSVGSGLVNPSKTRTYSLKANDGNMTFVDPIRALDATRYGHASQM